MSSVLFNTPSQIEYHNLATLKGALKLESVGIQMRRGPKLRKDAAIKMGLKSNAPYADIIQSIETKMNELLEVIHNQ